MRTGRCHDVFSRGCAVPPDPVCRAQRQKRQRNRADSSPPSLARVSQFLDHIDDSVPPDLQVHIILDNYGTHKTPLIRAWFAKRPRYPLHLTPTCGSWLNLVERWFAELPTKQIRHGTHRSVRELERAITEFFDAHNAHPKPRPKARTRFWPASPASPNAPQIAKPPNLYHEPLLQETKSVVRKMSIVEGFMKAV